MAGGDSGVPGVFPHQLADWWERGAGAARIRWGQGGDFMRCVRLAVDEAHMDPGRAKGFCAERHHAVLGIYPATHAAMDKHAGRAADGHALYVLRSRELREAAGLVW